MGNYPTSVAVADVNGDGRPDLVSADYDSDTVSVLLGKGDGTFASRVAYAVGDGPLSVVTLADVNGDGCPDLVTADGNIDTVSVLLGKGDGTFQSRVAYAVGSCPRSVALADLNGDGRPDIVSADTNSDTVSVLLGKGDGTFASCVAYSLGNGPYSVVLSDLNGDGTPEIVNADVGSDTVSVLLGQGDGTFASRVAYAVGDGPGSIALSDLNGDGRPDIVSANDSSDTVSVLINDSPYTTNHAPSGAVSLTGTLTQGQILSASNNLADEDGLGAISYQWKAGGAVIDSGATYTLTQNEVGKTVTVTASYTDSTGTAESVSSAATTPIANVNDAPTGSATANLAVGREETAYMLAAANLLQGFSDIDGDALTVINLTATHGTLTANASGWNFAPDANYNGAVALNYTVSDGKGGTIAAARNFTLTAVNDAPTAAISIPAQSASEGTAYSYSIPANAFTDVEGQALTYSASQASGAALPAWLSFNAVSRSFSGTVPNGTADLTLRVTARDTGGLSANPAVRKKLSHRSCAPS